MCLRSSSWMRISFKIKKTLTRTWMLMQIKKNIKVIRFLIFHTQFKAELWVLAVFKSLQLKKNQILKKINRMLLMTLKSWSLERSRRQNGSWDRKVGLISSVQGLQNFSKSHPIRALILTLTTKLTKLKSWEILNIAIQLSRELCKSTNKWKRILNLLNALECLLTQTFRTPSTAFARRWKNLTSLSL